MSTTFNDYYEGPEGIVGKRGGNAAKYKWYSHMPAQMIKRQIGEEIWHNYFKFSIVRNPFTKLISAYYFFKNLEKKQGITKKLKNRLKWYLPLSPEFYPPYVNDDPELDVINFKKWVKKGVHWDDKPAYTIDRQICVDYLMKFENLKDEIKHVCSILGLPFHENQIPEAKTAVKPHWAEPTLFFDEELIAIVGKKYEFELENFSYMYPSKRMNK